MNLRIGVSPIAWNNDDLPHVGGNISLDTCLREAAAAGYSGIELGGRFPRQAEPLAALLEAHGLALVSGWYGGRLLQRSAAEESVKLQHHLRLLKTMGCKVLVFAEVTASIHSDPSAPISRRPRLAPDQWALLGKRLSELAKMTADQGVALSYHHHMGTVIQNAQDIDRLMESTDDAVRLLLDTGHAAYAGAEPAAIAETHAGRVAHVHCKDVRAGLLRRSLNGDLSFLRAVLNGVFTVPGDGCIDYGRVLDALDAAGYQGWLVVEAEQDPCIAPPAPYVSLGYRHLGQLLDQSGRARGS